VSTDNFFPAEKPRYSASMTGDLFELIAPSWAQSETKMIFSRQKFAGRKYDACAISAQTENEVHSANVARRDERAFRYVSRAHVADGNGETQSRLLPSVARRWSPHLADGAMLSRQLDALVVMTSR
jgi:hypothetical protein